MTPDRWEMIDITTPRAFARLATLSDYLRGEIYRAHGAAQNACLMALETLAHPGIDAESVSLADLRAFATVAALHAAIVAAFEPLTAPDQRADVARILGIDPRTTETTET